MDTALLSICVASLTIAAIALAIMLRDAKRQAEWDKRNNINCIQWPVDRFRGDLSRPIDVVYRDLPR